MAGGGGQVCERRSTGEGRGRAAGGPLTKNKKLVSSYYYLYYDNDNVLRLMYDGPEVSSIYWPNPDNTPFQNGRTTYNSSRIAVLDKMGRLLSSDGLNVVASDFGPSSVWRRLTITQDGNLKIYSLNASNGSWIVTWQAMQQICKVHGLCGKNGICEHSPSLQCSCPPGYEMANPRNWTKGCRPIFSNNISKAREEYKFVKLRHTDFHGFDMDGYSATASFHNCKKYCLNMSSCFGFSYRLTGEGVCYPKSLLFNGRRSPSFLGSFYLKVPRNANLSSSLEPREIDLICKGNNSDITVGPAYGLQRSNTKWSYYYAFAAVLGGLEIFLILSAYLFLRRNQNIPKTAMEGYKLITNQFRRFTYRELKEATGNFKEEIGRGASGIVYRGVLDSKKVVAVKKLTNVTQGDEEFCGEMTVIARINHVNLIRIWGFCSEGKHKLLVHEYVDNESLDKHLFGTTNRGKTLGWNQRVKIALGTARGLAYLHHECLEWIAHCDVKPENILLTRDFEVKIADFGLAKLSKRDCSGFHFSHMRGTTGYIAPEWASNLPISAKVDVYSYGIVLLEIVMGTKVSSQTTQDEQQLQLGEIVQVLKYAIASGDPSHIVDPKLQGQFNPQQAMEMVKISLSCMEERSKRPTMEAIVTSLMACAEDDDQVLYV
ncbi:hypothetical protein ACP70R_037032 [Stipagrostis hirtigluma subsp. patula]